MTAHWKIVETKWSPLHNQVEKKGCSLPSSSTKRFWWFIMFQPLPEWVEKYGSQWISRFDQLMALESMMIFIFTDHSFLLKSSAFRQTFLRFCVTFAGFVSGMLVFVWSRRPISPFPPLSFFPNRLGKWIPMWGKLSSLKGNAQLKSRGLYRIKYGCFQKKGVFPQNGWWK